MNIKIVKNKYLNSLFVLMLFSAVIHMLVLFYSAITSGNFYLLNYFNILDLDLFLPGVFNNFTGDVSSVLFLIIAYIIILRTNKVE
ncbi:MAG: hypothetical protein Q7S77_01545 [Candidatus Staskawiczbacteria bacterium]|nr:hypothetical protein [Candidatus Staskawiczbacteria bacterium]